MLSNIADGILPTFLTFGRLTLGFCFTVALSFLFLMTLFEIYKKTLSVTPD
jgi:hypothetical protein